MIGYRKRVYNIINVVLDIPSNTTLNYIDFPHVISRLLGLDLIAVNERIQDFHGEEQIQKKEFDSLIEDYTIIQGQRLLNPCKLFLFSISFSSEDALNNFIEDKLQSLDTTIGSFTISKEVQRLLEDLDDLRYYVIEDIYDEIIQNKGLVKHGKLRRFVKRIERIKKDIEYEYFRKDSRSII